MKKPIRYLFSVLLTVLLVFCCLGAAGAAVFRTKALNIDTFTRLVQQENLPEKVHAELLTYFTDQENVTGIPADTYAASIAEDKLRIIITDTVHRAFEYLDGRGEFDRITPDFSALETDMTAFFRKYAEENGCEQDAVFDNTLAKAISAGEEKIRSACDVFRFSTLYDAGMLKQAKAAVPLVKYLLIGSLAGTAVLIVLLLLLNLNRKSRTFYWVGSAVLVSALLLLIPAVWLQATRWFDRFAVKSDQVFAAVTGYLYTMTGTAITAAVIGIMLAVCLYLLAGITGRARRRRPE